MEIIQEIGSYAGFAAVIGLAVLSALYFSQARDVKRLREWAGRAPDRPPLPAPTQRVVAQPISKPPVPPAGASTPPPVPRPPGAPSPAGGPAGAPVPAAARAAATGAAPAVARGPAPATPAAGAAPATGGDADGPDTGDAPAAGSGADGPDTGAGPLPESRDADERDDAVTGEEQALDAADTAGPTSGDADDDEATLARERDDDEPYAAGEDESDVDEGEETGEWSPEDEHSDIDFTDEHDVVPATPAAAIPRPPQPPRPFPRRATPPPAAGYGRADRGPILPPYADSRPEPEDRSAGGGRRTLLVAVVALAVLALGVFAALQLTGGDDSDPAPDEAGLSAGRPDDDSPRQAPIDPADVTVAVLNGTTVPGLAAQLGDKIAGQGFKLGTVTNNFDQERAESVVLFAPGAEREAADVSRRLDISQREPVDPDSQSLAGDATVVVVAGADQTQ